MKKLLFGCITTVTATSLTSCIGEDYFLENYENLKDEEHVFYEAEVDEVIDILSGDTEGAYVIYFGFPSCPWCQSLTPVLNEVAKDNYLHKKEKGQDVIYYYDLKGIRGDLTEEYLLILDELGLERPIEGEDQVSGVNRISVPYIVGVNDGEVIDQYFWDDTIVPKDNLEDEVVLSDLYDRLDILVSAVCGCE